MTENYFHVAPLISLDTEVSNKDSSADRSIIRNTVFNMMLES